MRNAPYCHNVQDFFAAIGTVSSGLSLVTMTINQKDLGLRAGQSLFNAVSHMRADIADDLTGTILDPYECEEWDDIDPGTFNRIMELW